MSCESTNELIRSATYDIIVITSMWGLILHTNLDINNNENRNGNNYNAKREITKLILLCSGIFSTAVCAYKYSK